MNQPMPFKTANDKDVEDMIKKCLHSGGGFLGIASSAERRTCGCADPNCKNGEAEKIEIFIKNLSTIQIALALYDLIDNADQEAKAIIQQAFAQKPISIIGGQSNANH